MSEEGQKIIRHELVHIREKHSYDKMISQIIVCLCWINPFYWLIQRELNIVHEFIADSKSIDEGDATSFAKMLLASHSNGRYLNPAHHFFESPVPPPADVCRRKGNQTLPIATYIGDSNCLVLIILFLFFTIYSTHKKCSCREKDPIGA